MKEGHRVTVTSLDFFKSNVPEARSRKLLGKQGIVKDIYLGLFRVEIDGEIYNFDGRELEPADKLLKKKVDLCFVSWQKNGKSVYGTKDEPWLFDGDFHRGVSFKASIELTEEEILRIQKAAEKEIYPVFDLKIIKNDRRVNRRKQESPPRT